MKILFLNAIGEIGGAERVLLDTIAAARDVVGAETHLIAFSDGPLLEHAREVGCAATVVPIPRQLASLGESSGEKRGWANRALRSYSFAHAAASAPPFVARLRKVAKQIEPDIVHSNGIKTHLLSRFLNVRTASTIWHLHDFCSDRPLISRWLRRAAPVVTCGIAVSRAVAEDAHTVFPGMAIETVPNAVDVNRFRVSSGSGERLDALAGLPRGDRNCVRVGLVATYAHWKGQDVFLRAAAEVLTNRPESNLRFYIVGGAIYQTRGSQFTTEELRRQARQLGIERHVGFVGFQSDTSLIYRDLDVVVHASTKPEPFGLTIAEAMASGRAVVVSAAGGAKELFSDGHDALGVQPSSALDLARAIDRLAADHELRQRFGQAARRSAEKSFSRARHSSQIAQVYRNSVRRAA